jgi:hypothetical protein
MQQVRKRAIASGCLVVLMGLFACSRLEPRSPIVEKVEQAVQEIWQRFQRMVCGSGSASTKTWPIR